jgi:N4-(beta-N-acetylglucosaminyl)-L-asparaginase
MQSRRHFIKSSALMGFLTYIPIKTFSKTSFLFEKKVLKNKALVLATWEHGLSPCEIAWKIIEKNGRALDAVENGVRVSESDPEVMSVGLGGLPDRTGIVSLDACIMDEHGNCGSVAFLQEIDHPISVARMVMEKTPHVMLAGKGAQDFALENGFRKVNLLTEKSLRRYEEWKASQLSDPIENHDTIGMVALDRQGNVSGACTTSGLAWKMHGRVGDSPIIGAGLFVDNEVGAATATGKGEAVIKIAGTHLIIELMRQGRSPMEACKEAVLRIVKKQKDHREFQVGFLALNKEGDFGAYSLQEGFAFALHDENGKRLLHAESYFRD